jgi:drug/metabolite transporter (DMT)-like permease
MASAPAAPPAARDAAVRPLDNATIALLSLIWGSAFLFIDVVVREVPPSTVVAGRLTVAGLLLLAIVAATGRGLPPRRLWPVVLAVALVNNVAPFTLITWAQEHIPSSLAATLNSTMPLFTFVIAVLAMTERPDALRAAGLAVGFVGAVVLIGPDLGDVSGSGLLADLAVLLASVCYATGTVISRQLMRGEALSLAAGQHAFGALIAVPVALAVNGAPDFHISAKAAAAWVALGVGPTAAAYVLFFWLIQRVTATQVSVVSYLIPVVATVLGWLVLDETVGPNLLLGLALVLVGMSGVNGNAATLWRRVRGTAPPPVTHA